MNRAIRSAICLALLGVALLIAGVATGLGGTSRQPGNCAAQRPNSPPIGSDPCVRSSSGGWHDLGIALLPLGVLALIGAGVVAITTPGSASGNSVPPPLAGAPPVPGQHG